MDNKASFRRISRFKNFPISQRKSIKANGFFKRTTIKYSELEEYQYLYYLKWINLNWTKMMKVCLI